MNDKAMQLIEASIDLFAQEGFWNTPTSRIAKHAGVGTGTLFNYFESKDGLIDAVYKQLKQEWMVHLLAGFPQDGTL
ncbi:MAG: helix-turn-helix transcriptional regulator, partial [Anaerolineales bacterium]|nr:helix-turn-helix transcriptional regulator [Anaerolineales bacterium]